MFTFFLKEIDHLTVNKMLGEFTYKNKGKVISIYQLYEFFKSNLINVNIFDADYAQRFGWGSDKFKKVVIEPHPYEVRLILPDPELLSKMDEPSCSSEYDPVKKPSNYVDGRKYEPRKVIHDWGLNFNLGNAVKYISRAGRKGDAIEDLKKAIQYIEFEIEELGGNQNE